MTGGQLRAILWLRWRLSRNQWSRSRGLGGLIAAAVGAAAILGGTASFAAGVAAGWFVARDAPPQAAYLVVCALALAFVFMWSVGVLVELQRSEVIDVPRLLQFPVGLAPVFLVNYAASHLAPSIVVFVPAFIGVAVGAAAAGGPSLLLVAPPALAVVFCTTAWTYCFQGWIAAWMTNPRRRRFVVMGLTLTIVLVGQLPNLLVNVLRVRVGRSWSHALREAAGPGGAVVATLALCALAAFALWRGYVDTLRFYRGAGTKAGPSASTHPASTAAPDGRVPKRRLVERRVPGLSEQASAIAMGTLRSVLRAPEAAMGFGAAMIITCIVGASAILRVHALVRTAYQPLVLEGALAFSIFMLVPFACNQFGFDRDGFRALVLSPVDRRSVLLGKNAACLAVGSAACIPLIVLASLGLRPTLPIVASAVLQAATMLVTAATVGNVVSVFVPYRMAAGSLKASGLPPSAWLAVLGCQLFFPMLFMPAFVPSVVFLVWNRLGWPYAEAVEALLSLLVAAGAALVYFWSLRPMARVLQRRETLVLARVTVEHE